MKSTWLKEYEKEGIMKKIFTITTPGVIGNKIFNKPMKDMLGCAHKWWDYCETYKECLKCGKKRIR